MKNIIKLFVITIIAGSVFGCAGYKHTPNSPKQDHEQYYPILGGGRTR